ncbi:MAG TPA: hypothetical protein VK920_08465 [Solirubrobacterales bacterium]|nr:hypothetical protein [Solirubrobacterales bacterium]
MRKRRISYLGALGLALALAIPGTAFAGGTQSVEAGFLPEFNANIPQPPPTANIGGKHSKAGTLYTRLFLENYSDPVPEAGVFDIHAPEELKFNTKGLDQCDPATIRNQSADQARALCPKAVIGQGFAEAYLGGPTLPGDVLLLNGTKQNGFSTVLFHSTAGTPVTLVAEMQQSPLSGYGTLFRTLVAQSAGGAVPDGIPIVDTGFTNSKKYTDKRLAKKAKKLLKKAKRASGSKAKRLKKKARRLKKKSKKSWVQGRCTDGELTVRIDVTYVGGSSQPQSDTATQQCT